MTCNLYKFTKSLMLYFNKNKFNTMLIFFNSNWLPIILWNTSKTSNYFEIHSFPLTLKVASLLSLDKQFHFYFWRFQFFMYWYLKSCLKRTLWLIHILYINDCLRFFWTCYIIKIANLVFFLAQWKSLSFSWNNKCCYSFVPLTK